jgi:hypothetical protein
MKSYEIKEHMNSAAAGAFAGIGLTGIFAAVASVGDGRPGAFIVYGIASTFFFGLAAAVRSAMDNDRDPFFGISQEFKKITGVCALATVAAAGLTAVINSGAEAMPAEKLVAPAAAPTPPTP